MKGVHPPRPDESDWRPFSRLTRLRLFLVYREDKNLIRAIPAIHHLSELDIFMTNPKHAEAFFHTVSLLTGLESLSFRQSLAWRYPLKVVDRIAVLTQLTRLKLSAIPRLRSLRRLTKMVDLEICFHNNLTRDVLAALLRMPSLASLKLTILGESHAFRSRSVEPSRLFGQLAALKTLVLRRVTPDDACIEAIGGLPDLTELRFDTHESRDLSRFYAQLKSLSNLRVLEVPLSWPFTDPQVGLLEGCMPRLREIKSKESFLEAEVRETLQKAFPCLRSVTPISCSQPLTSNNPHSDNPKAIHHQCQNLCLKAFRPVQQCIRTFCRWRCHRP